MDRSTHRRNRRAAVRRFRRGGSAAAGRILSQIRRVAPVLVFLGAANGFAAAGAELSAKLEAVLERAVAEGKTPGAVLLVAERGKVLYRKAHGSRSLEPERWPMEVDTIFDCASLTKVLVTAPAVMMLVEEGRLRLIDRVTKHLPEFSGGKSPITVKQLLTHFSGLRPDVDLEPEWSGYETGIQKAYDEVPIVEPGSRFIYSDINYILLAEIVRKISGKPLDEFARERIFEPLGMTETRFRPAANLLPRIAPTERLPDGTLLHGTVHDMTTRYMGGVAGHAGLFSTADDLGRFAQMMLNGGRLGDARVLSPLTLAKMTSPQSPPAHPALRGLGWDIDSPYSSTRGDLLPSASYGHTGYTGTSMWIDPITQTYIILLTNRVHPVIKTSVVDLRSHVANVVAGTIEDGDADSLRIAYGASHRRRRAMAARYRAPRRAPVLTGLDVLLRDQFKPLEGRRVGLITNHTGIDRRRRRNVDLFAQAANVELKAVLTPEHGLDGARDQANIPDATDRATGVPVYSLYRQDTRRPTAKMLEGLDALVFDIQDIGARFYTYATTMAYAMEEAAKHDIAFYVLDRPNPITGRVVEGPVLDEENRSFIGYFPMPVRHGMTVGELAAMFNAERKIGADLRVVKMEGWRRDSWFDETGLPWVDPSPNIQTLDQALLYPGIALLESLPNYSVGRGTATPFLFFGADWLDAEALLARLRRANLPGVAFYSAYRTPRTSRFAGETIPGIQINVLDRDGLQSTRVGLEIASALYDLHRDRIDLDRTTKLIGDAETIEGLKAGRKAVSLWVDWQKQRAEFIALRAPYLLY